MHSNMENTCEIAEPIRQVELAHQQRGRRGDTFALGANTFLHPVTYGVVISEFENSF